MKSFFLSLFCVAMVTHCNAQNTLNQIALEPFASGFSNPVGIYNAGDERLFILEQSQGDIEIIDLDGNYIGTFLDLTGSITGGGERGLLGLAFHPNYSTNGKFYVNYTDLSGDTRIDEFTVSSDPNVADANSGSEIITIPQDFSNHNGGHIAFGADGYLYIGMGDGGSAGDPNGRAQDGSSLLGKMLRIEVTGDGSYSIPADNPFIGNAEVLDEIWAIGLRNPWKFSFDQSTGDMWIGDVGQNAVEEVNFEPASSAGGLNYGWKCFEGSQPFDNTGNCLGLELTPPVANYFHSFPDGPCSITGGIVYRGSEFPNMQGHYFVTDYCDAKFYSLYPDGNGGFDETLLLLAGQFGFVAFGEDMNNELYVANASSGIISRIIDPCAEVTVSLTISGDSLLASGTDTYEWYIDGTIINNVTDGTYTPTGSGSYTAIGFNADGCQASSTSLSIAAGGLYIRGCTLPCDINYNPEAVIDDGSCISEMSCLETCPGDFNDDGAVTVGDLSGFLSIFGSLCE